MSNFSIKTAVFAPLVLAGALATFVNGEESVTWQRLSTSDIEAALSGRTIDYANARQEFSASGRSYYAETGGETEFGQWEARANRYCSLWPPSTAWSCYKLEQDAGDPLHLRFVGERGDSYPGYLRAQNQPADSKSP